MTGKEQMTGHVGGFGLIEMKMRKLVLGMRIRRYTVITLFSEESGLLKVVEITE